MFSRTLGLLQKRSLQNGYGVCLLHYPEALFDDALHAANLFRTAEQLRRSKQGRTCTTPRRHCLLKVLLHRVLVNFSTLAFDNSFVTLSPDPSASTAKIAGMSCPRLLGLLITS